MPDYGKEVFCSMEVFTQDIPNIKKFLNSLFKYDTNDKGIHWQIIECGMMIQVSFTTTPEYVEQIKNDYGELAFELLIV